MAEAARMKIVEDHVAKIYTRVGVLEAQVRGNGSEGHEQRIVDLEDRNKICGIGCGSMKEINKQREWKVEKVANLIAAAGIIIMIILFVMDRFA